MIPHLFYYQLVILGLLWLCVMLHLTWPSRAAGSPQKPIEPEPITPINGRAIGVPTSPCRLSKPVPRDRVIVRTAAQE